MRASPLPPADPSMDAAVVAFVDGTRATARIADPLVNLGKTANRRIYPIYAGHDAQSLSQVWLTILRLIDNGFATNGRHADWVEASASSFPRAYSPWLTPRSVAFDPIILSLRHLQPL